MDASVTQGASDSFDFKKIAEQVGSSQGSIDVAGSSTVVKPKIDTGRGEDRRKRTSGLADLLGWVFGAVAAVGVAYVILNTSMLDFVRGKAKSSFVAEAEKVEHLEEPVAEPSIKNAESKPSIRLGQGKPVVGSETVVRPDNLEKQPKELPNTPVATPEHLVAIDEEPVSVTKVELPSNRKSFSNRSGNDLASGPEVSRLPLADVKVAKWDVPGKEFLADARKELEKSYRSEIKGNDNRAKLALAKNLVSRSSRRNDPAKQYAAIQLAQTLARESGSTEIVLAASKMLSRQFDINFYEQIEDDFRLAISAADTTEKLTIGLEELLQDAREQEQFQFASSIAKQAARQAEFLGDSLQGEMLNQFAMDMRQLVALQKSFESAQKKPEIDRSPKDKMTMALYCSFGKQDWENGLALLSQGTDRTLADVAKKDLEGQEPAISMAENWLNLSQKSKYKGPYRRSMMERALELLDQGDLSNSNAMAKQIRTSVSIVKKYIRDPSLHSRTVHFEVDRTMPFDAAQLEQGHLLRIGSGRDSRTLPVHNAGDQMIAKSPDRQYRFVMRSLDNGVVEMKIFGTANNLIQGVLYGQ